MKPIMTIVLLMLAMSNSVVAQNFNDTNLRPHEMTLVPSSVRFEIIQSHIAARNTFRIDKYTGQVDQIVKTAKGDLAWEEINRVSHPQDVIEDHKVNYQIFTSGIAARFTFLMNVNTGVTWQLAQDPETDVLFWAPLK